ncbi:NB-ARC domain-containing protein [Acinetobacter baumannii]|uniref:NB-ARC domain-containing protein n=1 Tax=Acinetobacter baumannii TaxID=470 RepID=UPI00396C4B90
MIDQYHNILNKVNGIENKFEQANFLTPIIRSILQITTISILEIAKKNIELDQIRYEDFLTRLTKPSDGLPWEIIDYLVPKIRSEYETEFLRGWFEKSSNNESLSKRVSEWVQLRNKRFGHGVTDISVAVEWSNKMYDLAQSMLITFKNIIPSLDNKLVKYQDLKLTVPTSFNGNLIIFSEFVSRKSIWKLKGQYLSLDDASEFTKDLESDNLFTSGNIKVKKDFDLIEVLNNGKNEIICHNIPIRQTDMFEGRKEELDKVHEWLIDGDARLCLIYGDGGYGKTTLVLEILNKIIESNFDFSKNFPQYICFYSAKMTKWTEDGLVYFRSINPIIDDSIRELVRSQTRLEKEWFTIDGRALIDKASALFRRANIGRDDILLVIDNTETLATSPEEIRELTESLTKISKFLARVIVTSRRREDIAAEPVLIQGLTEIEGVNLLNRLASEYNAKPLIQAGESRLRKVSNELMNKPLLIEAFVKYISLSNSSIDDAIEKYFSHSDEELLEFLYEDAWQRMNDLQKKVFLVLVNVNYEIDNDVISRACQLIRINIGEFNKALEETHFATILDYGTSYTLEIVSLANRFFLKKFINYSELIQSEIKSYAQEVEVYVKEKEKVEKEFKRDRVTAAFRSQFAKLAKVYADKGEIDDAISMYRLAIQDDPLNSYLYDRFAWLLLNRTQNFIYALELSQKAVELDGNNIDAIVGLALAYYRNDDLENGDYYIDIAMNKGRTKAFCFLRKAIARYHLANKELDLERKAALYRDSLEQIKTAQKSLEIKLGYDAKNKEAISYYHELILKKINILRFS